MRPLIANYCELMMNKLHSSNNALNPINLFLSLLFLFKKLYTISSVETFLRNLLIHFKRCAKAIVWNLSIFTPSRPWVVVISPFFVKMKWCFGFTKLHMECVTTWMFFIYNYGY